MKKNASLLAFCFAVFMGLSAMDYRDLGDPFRHGKIRYCLLALVVPLFLFFKKRLGWPPAFVGALALFSWVTHDYVVLAEPALIQILACLALASAVVEMPPHYFGTVLILAGLYQAGMAFLQILGIHFHYTPLRPQDMHEMVGTYGNRTILGPFLVATLAPALWMRHLWAAIPILAVIILLKSTMTFAALAALLLIFFWSFNPLLSITAGWLGALVLISCLCLFPHFSGFDPDGRLQMWSAGWGAVKQAPLFGSGIASWKTIFLPQYGRGLLKVFGDTVPLQLHCDALDFAIEYGILGSAALLTALFQFIRRLKADWPHAVCSALLVNSAGNFPFAILPLALIFTVCFAYAGRGYG